MGELRDALHGNPNGKTAAEAEALYAEVQQLASETRAQQDALMDALREGRISGNDYIESSFEVDEAANRAADMQQEAERQVRYTSDSGQNARAAGVFMAEAATPYGTIVDIQDTMALWGEGRVLAASGMTLLTAVSVIPGVGLLRKADDVVDIARNTDRAGDAAGSANRGGVSGDTDGLQVRRRVNLRNRYMGRTPGKNSRTGREVQDRMREEGKLRESFDGETEFLASDGEWSPLKDADMSHKVDAVTWWNREGRRYGAKSKEVRQWMLDSENYTLDHYSINRSHDARLRETSRAQ